MSIQASYPSHAEAKKAGWFSRRHQTDSEHRAEQVRWRLDREVKRERELQQLEATQSWIAQRERNRAK